jgi:hypothetical protein
MKLLLVILLGIGFSACRRSASQSPAKPSFLEASTQPGLRVMVDMDPAPVPAWPTFNEMHGEILTMFDSCPAPAPPALLQSSKQLGTTEMSACSVAEPLIPMGLPGDERVVSILLAEFDLDGEHAGMAWSHDPFVEFLAKRWCGPFELKITDLTFKGPPDVWLEPLTYCTEGQFIGRSAISFNVRQLREGVALDLEIANSFPHVAYAEVVVRVTDVNGRPISCHQSDAREEMGGSFVIAGGYSCSTSFGSYELATDDVRKLATAEFEYRGKKLTFTFREGRRPLTAPAFEPGPPRDLP